MHQQHFVAVLSSTVLTDGVFECCEIPMPTCLRAVPSYVGHPDTAVFLTELGAVAQPKGSLFHGLQVGETYLAVPLANPDRSSGWTIDQAISGLSALKAKMVTRIS